MVREPSACFDARMIDGDEYASDVAQVECCTKKIASIVTRAITHIAIVRDFDADELRSRFTGAAAAADDDDDDDDDDAGNVAASSTA